LSANFEPGTGHWNSLIRLNEIITMSHSAISRVALFFCGILVAMSLSAADTENPLTAKEARKKVGETITVQMPVRKAKDRLEKRGEIYLDSELDFRDEKNFAVVITKAGAAKLNESGISNPAEHFLGKTIRARGKVKSVDGVPRIEIEAVDRIQIVKSP